MAQTRPRGGDAVSSELDDETERLIRRAELASEREAYRACHAYLSSLAATDFCAGRDDRARFLRDVVCKRVLELANLAQEKLEELK